jgi:hypothetical protein
MPDNTGKDISMEYVDRKIKNKFFVASTSAINPPTAPLIVHRISPLLFRIFRQFGWGRSGAGARVPIPEAQVSQMRSPKQERKDGKAGWESWTGKWRL